MHVQELHMNHRVEAVDFEVGLRIIASRCKKFKVVSESRLRPLHCVRVNQGHSGTAILRSCTSPHCVSETECRLLRATCEARQDEF